jgi:hypothetical protein
MEKQKNTTMKPLNQNKMDFALGLGTGIIITWAVAMRLKVECKKEVELLKDFDTWKEWKNKSE